MTTTTTATQNHDNLKLSAAVQMTQLEGSVDKCQLASDDVCMPMSVDCSTVASPVDSATCDVADGQLGKEVDDALVSREKEAQKNDTQQNRIKEQTSDVLSPDSNDSGIQADLHRSKIKDIAREELATQLPVLPAGWQKHEDEDGPYYWHIKSGTIQREPPSPSCESLNTLRSMSTDSENTDNTHENSEKYDSENRVDFSGLLSQRRESSTKLSVQDYNFPVRYAVQSLGWVHISEEDLTPERSSKAVNKCIMDLSMGRNDLNDAVGRWGDGKDLFMDLDEANLSLIDPQELTVLYVQPIHAIRVWGVGRENSRDFAYVARDRGSQKCMCHVFRCEVQARQIANTLRDICKKILVQKSIVDNNARVGAARPNNLPDLDVLGQKQMPLFPTPMEEPKKVLQCHYLGSVVVPQPSGVEMLNGAMEKLYKGSQSEKWAAVTVSIAPSTISITEQENPECMLAECRVRYLSFMAIALRNVKLCGFVMHTAQNQYIAHVFHAEPSAGALCKTIEAACKLRYQKCLDAHQWQSEMKKKTTLPQQPPQQGKGIRESIVSGVQSVAQNVLSKFRRKADVTSQ